jgi:cobalt-zinc-cadmium efflux system membrane fusion protein
MDPSTPPKQTTSTNPETTPSPATGPAEQRPHGHPTLVAATIVAAIAGAAVAVAVLRSRPAETTAPAGFTVNNGAVELLPSSPQWKYIDLARATSGAPLPPVPAPARVGVDEARSAPIYAPLPGRVERVDVQLGQRVKPGDKLLAIRSSSLPELGHEEESARAALAVKTAMADRVRDLVALRAVPEKDLVLAEQERREAELSLKAAEGKRKSLRIGSLDDSGLYWVTATKSGTVVERRALVGMEVGPDRADPLLSVADLQQVIVTADVLERDTAGLKVGQTAKVTDVALGGESVEGTVEYIAQLVDPARRTVAVRVRVPNPEHKLRPNAFAQVTFAPADASEKRVVVPAEAVVTDDQKSVVFVKRELPGGATRLERREVQVGRIRDDKAEVVSGLSDGETYVARGALLLLNALDLAS